MKVSGKHYRTIWLNDDGFSVSVIDQTRLPFQFEIIQLKNMADIAAAITGMNVRGAPLIGASAAYGMALAMHENPDDDNIHKSYHMLLNTRPTAVNLRWALDRMKNVISSTPQSSRADAAYHAAAEICEEDVAINKAIGLHGLELLRQIAERKGRVNILTHCNAGWLGTVDYGTALAPIYLAHDAGINVHVWAEETRPRNQGALTAWELGQHGVPHTYITDNAGGHIMQHGMVDIVIVGTDRTTANGDVCNKIGTYQKALAAMDNNIPFYAAVPTPSIDYKIMDGVKEIPIEERGADEIRLVNGLGRNGVDSVMVTPLADTPVANYGFDVTPARLITGLITEHGIRTSH